MQYRVVVPERVQKKLNKIDKRYKTRILTALISLRGDPYLGKKLHGKHENKWSYDVWPYRIVYKIKKKELIILIIRIGPRGGIYK